jgi:hypothetical protein
LAGNLDKPLLSLYGTEWRERGYGLCNTLNIGVVLVHIVFAADNREDGKNLTSIIFGLTAKNE